MGEWLQGTPLLQRRVLELVEKEMTHRLVQTVVEVVPASRGVGPAQEVGDVLEPVGSGAALGIFEGGLEQPGEAAHGLGLTSELGGGGDAGQPARGAQERRGVRADGPLVARVFTP